MKKKNKVDEYKVNYYKVHCLLSCINLLTLFLFIQFSSVNNTYSNDRFI